MPLQILRSQFRTSHFRRDVFGCKRLLREGAAGQLKFPGSPGAGFLLGAEVHDYQQHLQVGHSTLKAHVAGFRFHVAEVAQFEGGKRAVRFQGFPDHAGIIANAAIGIKPRVIAGRYNGFAHGQKIQIGRASCRERVFLSV